MTLASSSLVRCTLALIGGALVGAGCQEEVAQAPSAPARVDAPIVNGQTETGWPGVGALTVKFGSHYGGAYCTASLVAPDWVVTAGHCTTGPDFTDQGITPASTFFFVGNDARPTPTGGLPREGTFYAVDAFVPYPQYDYTTNRNDIGLVHLAEPVPDAAILAYNTTSLQTYFDANKPVDLLYVGFGATEGINESGSGLKRSTRFAISSVDARSFQSDYAGTGTCFGDSGGPNILEGDTPVIVGLTSAGDACPPMDPNCDPCQTETISTRVDAFAAWITTTIGGPPPTCLTIPAMCLCAEGCSADGVCDNTQCHVASCDDTYRCVVACGDDAACKDACIAAGTPDAQTQVQTLLACAEENCATVTDSDAHRQCVRDECRIPYNICTGRGPTMTGDETCPQVYDCVDGCSDFSCITECENHGTETAQTEISALLRCLFRNCGDATTEADYMACADASCAPEVAACFPPPTGDATCADVKSCADACADDACRSACRVTGTTDAQAQWDALGQCLGDHCAGASGDAAALCLAESCGAQAVTCVPGSVGAGCDLAGGDCPTGTACAGTAPATACVVSGGKAAGQSCASAATPPAPPATIDCADGLTCEADADGNTTCQPVCVDADGDGVCADTDCDDQAATTHPGAAEVCGDAIDNDCDGVTDDGCPTTPTTPVTAGKKDSSGCAGGGGELSFGLALGALALLSRRVRRSRQLEQTTSP